MDRAWYIKNLGILAGIPHEEIKRLASAAQDTRHERRALLYSPHKEETRVFLVKEGEVSLYHSRDGKRFIFDVMGPGSLFGNISMTNGSPSHFAEAAQGTRICAFSVEEFERIIAAHPVVLMRALATLGKRLEDYERKLAQTLVDAKEKVLGEIERCARKHASRHLTHDRLAKLTGLNRVTVTRALQELQESGRLTVDSL